MIFFLNIAFKICVASFSMHAWAAIQSHLDLGIAIDPVPLRGNLATMISWYNYIYHMTSRLGVK